MNIYEKLTAVQSELKAPKNQYNSFGKYNYRNLEDICEAVKPLLSKYKLGLSISDKPLILGDRFYIEASATLIDIEKPENKIINTASARESLTKKGMDDSQITGATSSYARKYCLNGLFCIDDTKDADSMDNRKNPPKKSSFLDDMKQIAISHPDIYKSHLKSWGMQSAKDIKNPESQQGILEELRDLIRQDAA